MRGRETIRPGLYFATNPATETRWTVVRVVERGDRLVAFAIGNPRGIEVGELTFGPRIEPPPWEEP